MLQLSWKLIGHKRNHGLSIRCHRSIRYLVGGWVLGMVQFLHLILRHGSNIRNRDVAAGICILREAGGLITTANPPADVETGPIEEVRLGSRLYLAIRYAQSARCAFVVINYSTGPLETVLPRRDDRRRNV